MEVIAFKRVAGVTVMDVDAILCRHPQVCLVDGLAYDNPAGSSHAKRWQDVEQLLAGGISVEGSVNLQYIDEYREQTERITGQRVTHTIPLSFVHVADEIEVVDTPARLRLGRADQPGANNTTALGSQQLSELREIALVLAADVVDHQLEQYCKRHGMGHVWGAQERILVWVGPRLNSQKMIESGRRNADRFHGELFVVYLADPDLSCEDKTVLGANLALARQLNAHIEALDARDPVAAIMSFACSRGVTQMFIGRGTHRNWWLQLRGNLVDRLIREAEGMDVRVFPTD